MLLSPEAQRYFPHQMYLSQEVLSYQGKDTACFYFYFSDHTLNFFCFGAFQISAG